MLQPCYKKAFEKDIKRQIKRGKNMTKLKTVVRLLLRQMPLPASCRDHALIGNFHKHRECHIEPDWLLIYKQTKDSIIFERTGTHSDLFK